MIWCPNAKVGTTSMYDLFRRALDIGEHVRCIKEVQPLCIHAFLSFIFNLLIKKISGWCVHNLPAYNALTLSLSLSFAVISSFSFLMFLVPQEVRSLCVHGRHPTRSNKTHTHGIYCVTHSHMHICILFGWTSTCWIQIYMFMLVSFYILIHFFFFFSKRRGGEFVKKATPHSRLLEIHMREFCPVMRSDHIVCLKYCLFIINHN
jgi:hypothetical protein